MHSYPPWYKVFVPLISLLLFVFSFTSFSIYTESKVASKNSLFLFFHHHHPFWIFSIDLFLLVVDHIFLLLMSDNFSLDARYFEFYDVQARSLLYFLRVLELSWQGIKLLPDCFLFLCCFLISFRSGSE